MGERDHYLHGAEEVRSAANTMSRAADSMRSAADTFSSAVERQISYQEEWLQRFEAIVERMNR